MNDQEHVEVSCYCMAYNHVEYIKSALDGFVNQKTNFKYQVIVHDDASTDGTADIIREYAEKYPDIIVPIYQTDNKYSKHISIFNTYILPLLEGEYIAVCEGDDYWCDRHKLQRQYDFLTTHPDYSACVHNTIFMNVNTKKEYVRYQQRCDETIPVERVFKGGGEAFHTSSIFYRRKYLICPEELCSKKFQIGDYSRAIYLAMNGLIYYFKDVMSVSRRGVKGSWSDRHSSDLSEINKSNIVMLSQIDSYTNLKYHDIICASIRKNEYDILIVEQKYKTAILQYNDIVKKQSKTTIIKIYAYALFPCLKHFIQAVKRLLKSML